MSDVKQIQYTKHKKIELVLQQLGSLPTLPAIAGRLLQITVKSNTQAQEVVRLIESDPSLSSKIIALASSAATGISRKTTSLAKAVVLLGFDAVRNAVLSIQVFESLKQSEDSSEAAAFDKTGLWKHALAVACGAQLLIRHINPKIDPEEAFTAGLLHDIGKLALMSALPKSYNRVVQVTESVMGNIADVEQKILGIDHTVAGKRLAEKWQLPDSITETIWLHHQWSQGLPQAVKNHSLIQAVQLADALARQQRIGYSGNHNLSGSPLTIASQLGCSEDTLEKITLQLRQLISERAAILGLDDIEPQQLYHEALGEANRELGQLNNRLQQQNYKLQIRSSYFDLLGKLARNVRPGQTVVDACGLIAGLWQGQIGSAGCAVYAMDKAGVFIEGAMKHASGDACVSFIVDRSEDPDFISPDMSAELSTGLAITQVAPQDSWFFEQVNPDFEIESTRTIPLRLGDKIIGGVLWQSTKPDEFYQEQLKEIEAFAVAAALILRQEQLRQEQTVLCEQLAQSNEQLQKAHQELLRKRNLASVGEMAAGAAHEINNPLAVIMGRTQLLASSETNPQRKESLDMVVRRSQQITDIITELMEFARPAQPAPQSLPVSELIGQAQKVVNKKLQPAKNITLDAKLSDTLPDVFVDGKQVSEALAELILNAIESYKNEDESGGGKITITARFNELENEIMLEIIDTGCGMDSQTLAKAADPFFSSKPAGRQRGLGLSRSIRNIESNGGTIRLESEPDRGTVARVMLPVATDNV